MIDEVDLEIIKLLQEDSRRQWKEIGEIVHLTGQAVSGRIRKLEDLGIIKGFTVAINKEKMGKTVTALITVFMKITNHNTFQRFIKGKDFIEEAHRVSGEGCYWLKVQMSSQQELTSFLDEVLFYGNYRVNMSIDQIV